MIAHHGAAVVQRGIEQLGDARASRRRLTRRGRRRRRVVAERLRSGFRLRLDHERQTIEELTHPGRQRGGQLVERAAHVALKRRRRQAFDERAREVDRGQLGERESRIVEPPERALLERPVTLAVVDLVEQRKSCGLKRLEIPADRARRDAGTFGEIVDRHPPRRFEIAQDRPLPDDFGVAHRQNFTAVTYLVTARS